jgi:hypothetical protein
MAKYGVFDLMDRDDDGNYRIGMYLLRVPNGSERGYALVDVRNYIPAKFYITQCLTVMNTRKLFRCGQCTKSVRIDSWNGANPAWPTHDAPICDDCFHNDYLGRVFDVQV